MGLCHDKNLKQIKHQRRKKFTKKSVLNMISVMEASHSVPGPSNSVANAPVTPDSSINAQEFLSTGRTGRRNAMPDILGQHAHVTSSDLSTKLQTLTTRDDLAEDQRDQPGTKTEY